MPKLPQLSARELFKILEKLGFEKIRQRGSHAFFIALCFAIKNIASDNEAYFSDIRMEEQPWCRFILAKR